MEGGASERQRHGGADESKERRVFFELPGGEFSHTNDFLIQFLFDIVAKQIPFLPFSLSILLFLHFCLNPSWSTIHGTLAYSLIHFVYSVCVCVGADLRKFTASMTVDSTGKSQWYFSQNILCLICIKNHFLIFHLAF